MIWNEAILNYLCHFLKQMTFIYFLRLEKLAAKAFLCTSHSPHGRVCMKLQQIFEVINYKGGAAHH